MPILYIHGVATRDRERFFAIEEYLRRLVAPSISSDPASVLIDDVFWGDLAADFAWGGISRPRSRILGMGADTALPPMDGLLTAAAHAETLKRLTEGRPITSTTGGLIAGGSNTETGVISPIRLKDLSVDQISDLLAVMLQRAIPDPKRRARLILSADAVARDQSTKTVLAAARTTDEEIEILLKRLQQRVEIDSGLVGMGGISDWFASIGDRISEAASRFADLPGYAVSVVAAELRKPLNDFISIFMGDVFAYINSRVKNGAPGEIPKRMLEKLQVAHANKLSRNGEPLVVLSHSMGGQIVYDAVTNFLLQDQASQGSRIDFWCATASQVGFFEEAKLFLTSKPEHKTGNPVPFPSAHLGVWWNVWDHNDFLSFTAKDIIKGIIDEEFDSGMSLLEAHGGYLERPSFYHAFANKLREAAARHWRTV